MSRTSRRSPSRIFLARLLSLAVALTSIPSGTRAMSLNPGLPHGAPAAAPVSISGIRPEAPIVAAPASLASASIFAAAMNPLLAPSLALGFTAAAAPQPAPAPLARQFAPAAADSLAGAARQAVDLVAPNAPLGNIKGNAAEPFETAGPRRSRLILADGDGSSNDGGSNGGSGNGNGPHFLSPTPSEVPIVRLNRHLFPGVGELHYDLEPEAVPEGIKNLGSNPYIAAITRDENGHLRPTATLTHVSAITRIGSKVRITLVPLLAAKITGFGKTEAGFTTAKLEYLPQADGDPENVRLLGESAHQLLQKYRILNPALPPDVFAASPVRDANHFAGVLAHRLPFSTEIQHHILSEPSLERRLEWIVVQLLKLVEEGPAAATAAPAPEEAPEPTPAGDLKSVEGFKTRLAAIGMPTEIQKIALAEFERLSKLNSQDSEATKLRTYLEWLTEVPWSQRTEDSLDLDRARAILEENHSGLDEISERILEFLAVRQKTGSKKGAILAFTGPPGVGKTSIASSIARALGRRFIRLSLGGVSDPAQLRGHGRTYVGALPGGIIDQMRKAGTVNPVFLLDEADKIGHKGPQGDPAAALLEILDPAQNDTFRDHYLNIPYDLSEVLFIVTANDLDSIPEPLRDRMEIIEFSGYTPREKIEIAQRHIIPEKLKTVGLSGGETRLTPEAIRAVIEGYTREAGVRTLRKTLEDVLRKISAWTLTRREPAPAVVDAADIPKYLGTPDYSPRAVAQNAVGVATGLAVNAYGGSTLNVEVSWEPGSGKLRLREQFGKMIRDSAQNALEYVKINAAKFGLEGVDFSKIDIDIDITPAGDVDGPSAGGLMVTAIVSALTGRAVKAGVAMTGEITKRGDILPIGGLKQKSMAAHRMGYAMVIYPHANEKDIANIPQEVRDELDLRPVSTYDEIIALALETQVTGKPAPLAAKPLPLFQARRPLAYVPAPLQPAKPKRVWYKPWTWGWAK